MKLAINLDGDILCPFQVFVDIAFQLAKLPTKICQYVFAPLCELETINDWINLESLGKPAAIRAQKLTKMLKPLFKTENIQTLELHMALADGKLSADNLYFLLSLAENLDMLTLYIYVHDEKSMALQRTFAALNHPSIQVTYNLPNKNLLPGDLVNNRYHILQQSGFGFHKGWLEEPFSDRFAYMLIGYSWVCLKAGAHDVGSHLLSKVLQEFTLTAAIREQLFMHLQLTRFLSHQYLAVTNEPFPAVFHHLKEEDAISINFIKAYSATLSRNLAVADTHFNRCHVNENLALTDENSLYRLNLFALFLVLQGQAEKAFLLEKRIENHIAEQTINIVGLNYVNFINIARLYKKNADFKTALNYYEKAYIEIKDGGYTPSDRIYYNMNMGSIHEAMGNKKQALHYWLNAALHWQVFDNKYALSWRPRLILCQEKMTDILSPLSISKVNDFLYNKLRQLALLANVTIEDQNVDAVQFKAFQYHTRQKTSYINNRVILFAWRDESVNQTLAQNKLESLLSTLVKQCIQVDSRFNVIAVNTESEGFYPQSDQNAWLFSKLMGCQNCYYEGRHVNYDNAFDERLMSHVKISLSPTISALNKSEKCIETKCSRSFLNQRLSDSQEIELVKKLEHDKFLLFTQLTLEEQAALFKLISKKIIVLNYPLFGQRASQHQLADV